MLNCEVVSNGGEEGDDQSIGVTKERYQEEAVEIIGDFRVKYKRKPAFVDELGKV